MASISRPKSEDVLHELLADLKRRGLDLTGRISYDPMCRSGGGGYGDVFRSSYNHNVLGRVNVAIKRVRFYIDSNQDIARVVAREVKVWSRLEHPNILPFLGFIVEESGFSSLVSEWMDNGTVSIYIKNHPKCNLMRIILGIAEGLAYLHDKNVIHADLKSDNVLISHKEVPLICDFGISKILAATQTLGGVCSQNDTPKGTVRWMAIELVRPYVNLNNDQASEQKAPEHTKESDVWSFGMTVYELLAKQFPYQHIHMDIVVMIAISNGALPACPASFAIWPIYQKSVWTICESCWNYDPSQRPQVLDVVQEMKILCSHAGQEELEETQSPQKPSHSIYEFERILAKIKHLDLTGRVTQSSVHRNKSEVALMDIYEGRCVLSHRGAVDVVINRPRIFLTSKMTDIAILMTMWSKVKHPNIHPFLGYINDNQLLSSVFERADNGTLRQYAESHSESEKMTMILGIAEGLGYLHEENVVHSNLNPDSILISTTGQPMISDIGMRESMDMTNNSDIVLANTIHMRYMAIELFGSEYQSHSTKESDIWSFGMTTCELLAEQRPYSDMMLITRVVFAIFHGQRPSRPPSFNTWPSYQKRVWNICMACWEKDPRERPPMSAIVSAMKSLCLQADAAKRQPEHVDFFEKILSTS